MKQILIDKFLDGLTSQDEEKQLKNLLQAIPFEQLNEQEKEILSLLSFGEIEEDEDIFAEDLSAEYERILAEQSSIFETSESLAENSVEVREKPKIRSMVWKFTAIAAAILLLFSLSLIWDKQDDSPIAQQQVSSEKVQKVTARDEMHNSRENEQNIFVKEEQKETTEKSDSVIAPVNKSIPKAKPVHSVPSYNHPVDRMLVAENQQETSTSENSNQDAIAKADSKVQLDEQSLQRRKRVEALVDQYLAVVEYNDPF